MCPDDDEVPPELFRLLLPLLLPVETRFLAGALPVGNRGEGCGRLVADVAVAVVVTVSGSGGRVMDMGGAIVTSTLVVGTTTPVPTTVTMGSIRARFLLDLGPIVGLAARRALASASVSSIAALRFHESCRLRVTYDRSPEVEVLLRVLDRLRGLRGLVVLLVVVTYMRWHSNMPVSRSKWPSNSNVPY